jgi:transcription elongation factor GreA
MIIGVELTFILFLILLRNFVASSLLLGKKFLFEIEIIHFNCNVMSRIFTEEGLRKLKTELDDRRLKIRHEIAFAIKEAKEQGDLSENAEYSEAKRHQNENESRIAELEGMLKDSVVATKQKSSLVVGIGSKLTVKVNNKELHFEIVGSNEVDPAQGKISNESPLGKEFIGKSKGDKVEVSAPVGAIKYEIIAIK